MRPTTLSCLTLIFIYLDLSFALRVGVFPSSSRTVGHDIITSTDVEKEASTATETLYSHSKKRDVLNGIFHGLRQWIDLLIGESTTSYSYSASQTTEAVVPSDKMGPTVDDLPTEDPDARFHILPFPFVSASATPVSTPVPVPDQSNSHGPESSKNCGSGEEEPRAKRLGKYVDQEQRECPSNTSHSDTTHGDSKENIDIAPEVPPEASTVLLPEHIGPHQDIQDTVTSIMKYRHRVRVPADMASSISTPLQTDRSTSATSTLSIATLSAAPRRKSQHSPVLRQGKLLAKSSSSRKSPSPTPSPGPLIYIARPPMELCGGRKNVKKHAFSNLMGPRPIKPQSKRSASSPSPSLPSTSLTLTLNTPKCANLKSKLEGVCNASPAVVNYWHEFCCFKNNGTILHPWSREEEEEEEEEEKDGDGIPTKMMKMTREVFVKRCEFEAGMALKIPVGSKATYHRYAKSLE